MRDIQSGSGGRVRKMQGRLVGPGLKAHIKSFKTTLLEICCSGSGQCLDGTLSENSMYMLP